MLTAELKQVEEMKMLVTQFKQLIRLEEDILNDIYSGKMKGSKEFQNGKIEGIKDALAVILEIQNSIS